MTEEEKIERMARAIWERDRKSRWEVCTDKQYWRDDAKAALAALEETPAQPELPEGVELLGGRPDRVSQVRLTDGTRLKKLDYMPGIPSGYIVTEQYILNKIQEDMK